MLTESQVRHFKAFGYVVMKQVLTAAELRTLHVEFERKLEMQYAHRPFDGTSRHWSSMMDDETPLFASLLEDPRFMNSARQLFGPDVIGLNVDANRYVGNTAWHPDSQTPLQGGVKFAIYLPPVGAETGALRVIPGSHRLSYPQHPEFADVIYKLPIADVPATVLDSTPGDVVAFDIHLWHGSWGGKTDRRMCTAVYYDNPRTPEELAYIRKQAVDNITYASQAFDARRKHFFPQVWLANAQRSADRQRWIDRLRELGYFDAPGIVEPAENADAR